MSLIDVSYGSVYIRNSLKSLDQTPEKSVQQMSKSLAASPLKVLLNVNENTDYWLNLNNWLKLAENLKCFDYFNMHHIKVKQNVWKPIFDSANLTKLLHTV